MARRRSTLAVLAAAAPFALLCAAPGVARAGVTAQAQPGYSAATTTARDETGAESRVDTSQWLQRYRLSLDEQPYPLMGFSAGANLDWTTGDSRATGVPRAEFDNKTWNTFARLGLGGNVLSGALDYTRRWDDNTVRSGGVTLPTPGSVRETYGGSASWRPADLPTLSLRLSRTNAYDVARTSLDQTTDEASLATSYRPQPGLDLRYSVRYGQFTDHRTDLVRSDLSNAASVAWDGKYLQNRGVFYLSYSGSARTTDTRAPGGTVVPVQQLPIAGLSIVEVFPATPLRVTLSPNAELVNGITGVSAGVNLGTSAGGGPAIAPRDLGAQFQDVITPVNAIQVYVDRTLPPALSGLFTWTAYRSDDNVDWVPVPITGAVSFDPVLMRFEVPIGQTQARYLKVVTSPLPSTATPDPQFGEIFVTELQFYNVIPAELARGRSSDLAGNLNGTTRIVLVPDLGLSYDFTGRLSHGQDRPITWAVVNGVSLARRLDRVFAVAARVERSDGDAGRGEESQNRWSTSLSADPVPTLGGIVSYSGQLAQTREGTSISNTGSLGARADLYEGIAANASTSVSLARTPSGLTSTSYLTAASTSVVPNRFVSLTGSGSFSSSVVSAPGLPDRRDRRGVVEMGASVMPVPALALSGSVARQFGGSTRPTTLASFTGGFSPFPGGDLQLRYTYSESYESAAQRRTRAHGPGARWNIRSGWNLEAGYSVQDSTAPASSQHTRAFNANLLITFR